MNKNIRSYLIATFLVSWVLWGIVALASKYEMEWLMVGKPIGTILYVLGGVSPAICELILKYKSSSKIEHKKFVKSIVNIKHSKWLYLYAIGGAILIQAIPVCFGLSTIQQPFYIGFIMIIPMIIGGGLEEIGWRGLLQPELERKLPHWIATIFVGAIWTIWHLPLWFISGTNQQGMSFLWFSINAIMLSFFIGSITYVSGSIFMAILAHAAIGGFWEIMEPTYEIVPSIVLMFIIVVITSLIDHYVKRKRSRVFCG